MKFKPSKELKNFANKFAKMCMKGTIETGSHHSSHGEYNIEIMSPAESKTFCRVGNTSGDIQFSRNGLRKGLTSLNEESIYFFILWCICKFNDREKSDLQCDNMVIDHFLRDGLDLVSIPKGMTFAFEKSKTKANLSRIKNIKDTIK